MTRPAKYKYLLLPVLLAYSADRAAAQDISVSMAECSAIYDVLAESAGYRGKPENQIQQMLAASSEFKAHAVLRAESEGRANPEQFIAHTYADKRLYWAERWFDSSDFSFLANFSENMEWTKYCASMGKHFGVLPLK
ncbi:hypothetical protein ACQUQP_16445 [Marinobacterium sp. YM272]|uniref:hypothetical protein n=1 Tax=Marinobacterium sp. YM272 TaxID=3421654 RepID=UPI003D7FC28E